ncbi:uncharacterized protein LOC144716238 [Wolffia australiana]
MAETKRSVKKTQAKKKKKERPEKFSPWENLWGILNCKRRLGDVSRERRRRVVIVCLNSQSKPTKASKEAAKTPPTSSLSPSRSSPSSSSLRTGSSSSSSSRGLHLSRFTGCYECQTAADPIQWIHRSRSLRTISPCPDCGELFFRPESLEQHQIEKHAVMEMKPGDSSRDIVEIIFHSSWLKEARLCEIERILKINNTKRTIGRFEEHRSLVKSKAGKLSKKHPRCAADGNEQLRFYSVTVACDLGSAGATALCTSSAPPCGVCSIIRDGFKVNEQEGIATMATSGKAHNVAAGGRAMLVCRVIAGRVKKQQEGSLEEYDSVSGDCSAMDELVVFNPRAILPCFVVIYRSF